jgi:hypothetical protein
MVSFMPLLLYHRGESPQCTLNTRLGGPQSWSRLYGEVNILDPSGTRTLTLWSSSLYPVAIPIALLLPMCACMCVCARVCTSLICQVQRTCQMLLIPRAVMSAAISTSVIICNCYNSLPHILFILINLNLSNMLLFFV